MKKKRDDSPDMFGSAPSPAPEKKTSTKAEAKSAGMQVAHLDGNLSGIPKSLATASEALGDVLRRCREIKGVAGILTHPMLFQIEEVEGMIRVCVSNTESCRRVIDSTIAEHLGRKTEDEFA